MLRLNNAVCTHQTKLPELQFCVVKESLLSVGRNTYDLSARVVICIQRAQTAMHV